MKNKIKLILFSVFSSVIIIALIANIDVVGGMFDSLFGGKTDDAISRLDKIYFYLLKAIIYFFLFLYAYKKFLQSAWFTFGSIIAPAILVDATVFIDGITLVPLRFPFETFFPVLGAFAGVTKVSSNKKYFLGVCLMMIVFSVLSRIFFIPGIIHYMEKRDSEKITIRTPFVNEHFLTINQDSTRLEDTVTGKCSLIEFYFVGCMPCVQKFKFLKELVGKINSKEFKIFMICDGSITSYRQFIEDAEKNRNTGFVFLYAIEGSVKKMSNLTGYPYELVLDGNKQVISSFLGFNIETSSMYISNNYKKIKQIINE